MLAVLNDLRKIGVGVALDDFGTGYASLGYLRKFPFSKLKIDQSFVLGMEEREDCIIIIQAVAAMAKRLGMTVTAEGIETDEQLAIVREAGCTHGQGYLFGRPRRTPTRCAGSRWISAGTSAIRDRDLRETSPGRRFVTKSQH